MRVLIVDDDTDIRDILAEQCRLQGFVEVLQAVDGREALMLLGTKSVDAVLTDLRMPNMDGIELARLVASQYPAMPVYMLTGFGDQSTEALSAGVRSVFLKPDGMTQALDALCQVVKKTSPDAV